MLLCFYGFLCMVDAAALCPLRALLDQRLLAHARNTEAQLNSQSNPKTLMTHRWHRFALSAVAVAMVGLHSLGAQALSLGPVIIQSALGEALRAEIDILEMNAEEAATLKTQIASPEAFRAAGLDYNSAMASTRVSVLRRANGRSYIRLVSDRPVNEPFIDMILEATWSGGRIVRDYTMLLDPPALRASATTPAPTAQVVAQDLPAASAPPAPAAPPEQTAAQLPARPAAPKPATGTAKAPAAAMPTKPAAAAGPGDKQVTVKTGDNASKIALASKASNVSLDQMLVALLRANPDAFINGNLNRLKRGAVLNLPGSQDALATDNVQARQIVVAQSRDFGEFRNKLAGMAPSAQVATADRQAAGGVQSRVDDKKTAASAPDKLTLSKGGVQAKAQADQVAKTLSAKEAASQKAEVSKTIAELAKVAAAVPASGPVAKASAPATTAGPAAAAAKPASAPVASVAAVAAVAAPATTPVPAPVPAPAATASATKPAVAASAAATPALPPVPAKPVVKAPPAPLPEPGLIDKLTENPLVPAAGAALVALLAGFGLWRVRKSKNAKDQDSAFLDSRLQPDSFFGSSGGQRVDTNETGAGTSIVYSPSQLDAADDVDPVAEADVYLAYGRDLQAEEILKEALKTHGGRLSVHQKLLEIYGKRRDTRNFELTANEAFKLTAGEGQDWIRVCEQGLSIDPGNPLYMPGGKPSVAVGIPSQPMPLEMQNAFKAAASGAGVAAVGAAGLATVAMAASAVSTGSSTSPLNAQPAAQGVDLDFDLDLDFSLDDDNAQVITDMSQSTSTTKIQAVESGSVPLDMDFDMPEPVKPVFATQTAAFKAPVPNQAAAAVVPETKPGVIEFELHELPGAGLSNSGEVSRPAPLESMDTLLPLEFEPPEPQKEVKKEPGLSLSLLDDGDEFKQEAARSFGTTQTGPLSTFAPKLPETDATTGAMELMDFNIGNLPLDIGDGPRDTQISDNLGDGENPLATKLSLAEEFNSIGDTDGARALIEEVVQEATGDLKVRAQKALAALA